MIKKTITFVPLLFQLFDEILVSAADRKGVKDILVNINVADNKIGVWTHGGGLDDINFSIIGEALGFGFVSVMNGDGNEVPGEEFPSHCCLGVQEHWEEFEKGPY
ncbi:DNA topoisomerase 2 [Tanacetum coccineum]